MTEDLLPSWAILELMGHRTLVGYVQEVEVGGDRMLRIDVPQPGGGHASQVYSPKAVYCLTPATREAAEKHLSGDYRYRSELRALPPPEGVDYDFSRIPDDPDEATVTLDRVSGLLEDEDPYDEGDDCDPEYDDRDHLPV